MAAMVVYQKILRLDAVKRHKGKSTCYFLAQAFPLHFDIFKTSLDITLEKLRCSLEKRINICIRIFLFEVIKLSQALK